ncbi:hypothetical protein P691DRAFT_589644 [Macrolepiota fuliginosa MF-IS2]|uniref:Uncharacterized protein n=1 Tax=Macrolepiota fuliginosa MF-IS2 TaxID=1400762 RepID=A0A9P5XEZ2_9AGAR|nr:hypothetical protein P691DRAFT_589644 [Macrolepiota fuliginosa MF-IS2]
MSSYEYEEIQAGDIVAVRHGTRGRQEGLVIGSHVDYSGRQIIEVQLEGEVYNAWYPTVTRVKRVVSYHRPTPRARTTVERRIYW